EGTPLADMQPLTPVEILITIALYRFILPDKDIKLCGGKEKNLRQLLPLGIVAGCNSLMTGNYLTTLGRDAASDIEMIKDLGFTVT
ncbi:MAG: biotin synthase BioB, partial [Deltaproteobacteria bacterium]